MRQINVVVEHEFEIIGILLERVSESVVRNLDKVVDQRKAIRNPIPFRVKIVDVLVLIVKVVSVLVLVVVSYKSLNLKKVKRKVV